MSNTVHVELFETGSAEGMTTVNHDAGNTVSGVIMIFAERTVVLVEELVDELVDFLAVEVWRVFCLFEEEGGRVLKFFSHEFKIYSNQLITKNNWQLVYGHHDTKSAALSSRLR